MENNIKYSCAETFKYIILRRGFNGEKKKMIDKNNFIENYSGSKERRQLKHWP